jgi:hypothetical protein
MFIPLAIYRLMKLLLQLVFHLCFLQRLQQQLPPRFKGALLLEYFSTACFFTKACVTS